ncbi:MAG: ATPase [Halobacteriaceae archaeon]
MRLLVAGADRVDAGKTTFSTGLLSRVGGTGFKPRAGNSLWFDHDDVRRAVREGRLYGKDAYRLAAASAEDVTAEDINPIHRLWRPDPGAGGLIGAHDRAFVCDRVGDSHVVNGTAEVPALVADGLPLDDAVSVASVEELNTVTERRHLVALDQVAARVRARDRTVVESYGDVARPLRDLSVDAVAVVEPGRARVYDGERYGRACEVAGRSPRDGRLERRVTDVLDYLDPAARVSLPPLTDETRTDPAAVADAYAPAYDELLAVASQ